MKKDRLMPRRRFIGFNEEWELQKFNDVFKILPNNTFSRAELTYDSGFIRNVHYGDVLIKFGECLDVSQEELPFISNCLITSKYKHSWLQDGDIIISDTAEDEIVGKCTEIANIESLMVLSGLHTIPCRPNNKFETAFLGYYMNSAFYHNQLIPLIQGIKVASISKSALKNTELSYPKSHPEQKRIGEFFQCYDKLIHTHEEKLLKLKAIKKAYLYKMFPQERENIPKRRFPGFTDAWEQRKLNMLGEIQTGNTPPTSDESNYDDSGMLWVTPTDINSLVIKDTAKKLSKIGASKTRIAKAGSILVTCIASIGKNTLATMDVGFNQQINSLTPGEQNDSYFLLTQSDKWSEKMKSIAASGTMQIVNKSEFSNITTMVPKHDEQVQIGKIFKNVDTIINLQQRKIEKLQELKQAYLNDMFV